MAFLSTIARHIVIHRLMFLGLATAITNAPAATLMDDFIDEQFVMSTSQTASGPSAISSGFPGAVTRTLSIHSSGEDDSSEMHSYAGHLRISNDYGATSVARVIYEFDGINVGAVANAWLVDIADIDLDASISLIANATSEFLFQPISQSGPYIALFSAFSNPGVFDRLTRLELRIVSSENADMRLSSLSATRMPNAVPEPGIIALLIMGLPIVSHSYRRVPAIRI